MIITLCGSARFEPWFHAWNEALSLSNHTVFGLSVYPSFYNGKKNWYDERQKQILDQVHFQKINVSDAILVLNVFAYIGESTLKEIEYARSIGKKTYFLESWGQGNGIGNNHSEQCKKACDYYGVPVGFGSPISTVASFNYMTSWDLLPPASSLRSQIVKSLDKHKEEAINKYLYREILK